jgi:3-phosphoshikimate 1-carboxyvinyltransferase
LAALANGPSVVNGVPDGDDVVAMIEGLRSLGVRIETSGDVVSVLEPIDLDDESAVRIDAALAGTTSRFLIAAAALRLGSAEIVGGPRLSARPFGELIAALRELGALVDGGPGLPVTVRRSSLHGGVVQLSGEVSSQFLSALLMIGPLLDRGLRLEWTGRLVSRPYLEMTAAVMQSFGVVCEFGRDHVATHPASYVGREYRVEVDASSAAYPAAAVAVAGGSVRIKGAANIVLQPDRAIFDILEDMGCRLREVDDDIQVHLDVGTRLRPVDVDLRDASDLVPTVAAIACVAEGTSRIRGVGFVRAKESDRIGDLAAEIRKFGIEVVEHDDGLDVVGGQVRAAKVDPHDDHRLAMALSLLGLVAPGTTVSCPTVVGKSWPGYFEAMDLL